MAKVSCNVDDCQFCDGEGSCINTERLEIASEDCFCSDCKDCDCYIPL